MSISSIGGEYSSLSLVDFLGDSDENADSILDTSVANGKASALIEKNKKARQNAYGAGLSSSTGQAALKKALAEMDTDGRVTFADIAEHQKKLEGEFSSTIRADLAALGVSKDTEFSLTMNVDGSIKVNCEDAMARQKIQQYLENNPEVCEQFGYIQALANLDRAKQSPVGSYAFWQDMRNSGRSIQSQAVEKYFGEALAGGMGYSPVQATFGASEQTAASFYTGISYTV